MTNCVVCRFKATYPTAKVCTIDETQGKPTLCEKHEAMRKESKVLKFKPDYRPVNVWAGSLKSGLYFYKVTKK